MFLLLNKERTYNKTVKYTWQYDARCSNFAYIYSAMTQTAGLKLVTVTNRLYCDRSVTNMAGRARNS